MDTLVNHAINGFQGSAGVMPAKGGNPSLSDEEVTAAVEHMVSLVGGAPGMGATGSEDESSTAETGESDAGDASASDMTASSDTTQAANASDEVADSTAEEVTEETTQAVASAPSADGEAVYKQACFACHTPGIAGAPKLGDADAWTDRIAQGMDTMVKHAIEGYQGSAGVMPAKGGNPSLSDAEVTAAVQYMADQSQ